MENYTAADGLIRRLFDENGFTRVAHLAAESHVDRSIDDPEAFLQTNVLGTFTLLKSALDHWRAAGTLERCLTSPSNAATGKPRN